MIPRFLVLQMAAFFGEKSLAAQALRKASELGGHCRFFLIAGHYIVVRA